MKVCECGHPRDEHLDSFSEPCDVTDCLCIAFDEAEPEEESDEAMWEHIFRAAREASK